MTYTTEKKRDFAKEKRGSRIAILPYFMVSDNSCEMMKYNIFT
jgi:hypothetical protein